ncbi:MAG: TetR/AcrR family transcriptional regulator [Spirochaetes bacterium]|nr:TetR/AcrR family transcriptional regulator [Spirochaetota bacterium]
MRSEETRTRILQSAMKLFSETGFDATGVAEICGTAGVSKGAFYHHFETKQAVFLQLLEDWLQQVDADLQTALRESPTVVEGLLGMAARTREVFSAADGRLSILLEFWSQARKDPVVWERTIAPFRRYRDAFAGIVRKGIAEGSLRPIDADKAAQALMSLAVGIVLQGVLDPKGARWDRVIQDTIGMLVEGIGRKQS